MSDWIGFQLTQEDLSAWGEGITPCPIAMALKRLKWMDGEEREVFTRPFRGLVQMGDELYQLCESGRRFQRHIRESEKLCTPEELIKFGLIYSTRLWIRWHGESDYNIEWLRKCQRYKPERKPVSIPKVTGKSLGTDDAFDLMRERWML
jgi:hypothetical protein